MKSAIVFGSGGGSNFKAIFNNILSEKLALEIRCVISNNSTSGILEFARQHSLDTFHLSTKKFPTDSEYLTAFENLLEKYQPDYIILAGFMKKIPVEIIQKMENRVLNIHPALLPKFGGKGMYGMNVHNAVKEAKEKISGATVHFVTENYDEGPIVLQREVKLSGNESAEQIAEKILKIEHKIYTQALQKILEEQND
jgi:formyltetrahydrofolate-dependent phosphoribosylglycinamide formyltransferase